MTVKVISSKDDFIEMYKTKLTKLEINQENSKAMIQCLRKDLQNQEDWYSRDMTKSRQAKEENMELIPVSK